MSSERSRAAHADCPPRDPMCDRFCFISMLLGIASVGAVACDASQQTIPDVDAVQRARSCVLKVECRDRSAGGSPTVLSAVALDDDGYIVTVGLRSPANRTFVVKDCSGKSHEARWIAWDEPSGLTVLKLEPGVAHAPPLATALPPIGTGIILVGNPFGLSHSVSLGVVSGVDRSVSYSGGISRGLIQFAAPLFPGDGGGLLADHEGRMLGIVSTALKEPGVEETTETRVNGIGFAIPAAEMRRIVQRLREGRKVERGYLGLTAEDVDGMGIRVITVIKESPALNAGVREGDLIEAMDDREVNEFDELAGRIERLRPGTQVSLRVKRANDRLDISATLGDRSGVSGSMRRVLLSAGPDQAETRLPAAARWELDQLHRTALSPFDIESAVFGVHTQPVTESLAKSLGLATRDGALISSVVTGSPSDRAGLRASDVIVSLNDEVIRSPQQLLECIRRLTAGSKVQLQLVRDGKQEGVEISLSQGLPGIASDESLRWLIGGPWSGEPIRSRIELLEERIKLLEARLHELQKRLDEKPAAAPAPEK